MKLVFKILKSLIAAIKHSIDSFISNVTVGDLVSDHALVKCHLDFACPAIPKVNTIFIEGMIK